MFHQTINFTCSYFAFTFTSLKVLFCQNVLTLRRKVLFHFFLLVFQFQQTVIHTVPFYFQELFLEMFFFQANYPDLQVCTDCTNLKTIHTQCYFHHLKANFLKPSVDSFTFCRAFIFILFCYFQAFDENWYLINSTKQNNVASVFHFIWVYISVQIFNMVFAFFYRFAAWRFSFTGMKVVLAKYWLALRS